MRRIDLSMYICICNALTERQVSSAIDAGAADWVKVHAYHGHVPNCGQCECEIFKQITRLRKPLTTQAQPVIMEAPQSGGD